MVASRLDTTRWLSLAEAAIDLAIGEGATQAEALVTAEQSALTRFANSEIHQNVAETNAQLNLRFVIDQRVGVASTGRLDPERPAGGRRGRRQDRPERRGERRVRLAADARGPDPRSAGRLCRRDGGRDAGAAGGGCPRGDLGDR